MRKKTTKIALLLAMVMCLGLMLTGCGGGKTTIDLTNYLSVSFSGTDGEGTARVIYDDEGAAKAVAAAMGIDDLDNSSKAMAIYLAVDEAEYEVTPRSGLSNGDEVTVTISITDTLDSSKVTLVGGSGKTTVEGLSKKIESASSGETGGNTANQDSDTKETSESGFTTLTDEDGNILFEGVITEEEELDFIERVIEKYPDMEWLLESYNNSDYDNEALFAVGAYIALGSDIDEFYKTYGTYEFD